MVKSLAEVSNNDGVETSDLKMGNLSGTLHFIALLGQASKQSKRKVGESYVKCPTTVGVRLKTDVAVEVPVIDVLKNKDSGIKPSDISSRSIKAGQTFDLNMYELMYFIVRDDYVGYISRDNDPQGVYFAPKMQNFIRGEASLPTPALIFKPGTGAIKADMLEVDEKVNGNWTIKKEFADKFEPLMTAKSISTSSTSNESRVSLVALALKDMLNLQAAK